MRVTPFVASKFGMDGGVLFGQVPKPLWEKKLASDEQNRVPQNANCLLVELDDGRKGIVDTGCSSPEFTSEKEREIFAMDSSASLVGGLEALGVKRQDIHFVILSHLHFDHAGGVTWPDGNGGREPTFPNAMIYAHEQEWKDATSGDPVFFKMYPSNIIDPLRSITSSTIRLVDDANPEVFPGVRMMRSGGHTEGHCVIELEHPDLTFQHPQAGLLPKVTKAIYPVDVCPSQHHLRMVFQTSFDTFPLITRAWKRERLAQIADEKALLLFAHDRHAIGGIIRKDDRQEFAMEITLPVVE